MSEGTKTYVTRVSVDAPGEGQGEGVLPLFVRIFAAIAWLMAGSVLLLVCLLGIDTLEADVLTSCGSCFVSSYNTLCYGASEAPPRVPIPEGPSLGVELGPLEIASCHEGVQCQVCGEAIAPAERVYCPLCSTPHHRDCADYLGRCSTYACRGRLS